jgi:hypothetical protein
MNHKDLGTQWGILKTAHYYFDQAVKSGQKWHIEQAGKSLGRALEQYAELAAVHIEAASRPSPPPPPSAAEEMVGLAAKKIGRIVSGKFVKEE